MTSFLLKAFTACPVIFLLASSAKAQSIEASSAILGALIKSEFVSANGVLTIVKQGNSYIIRGEHQTTEFSVARDGSCYPISGTSSPTSCEINENTILVVGEWTNKYTLINDDIVQDEVKQSWGTPIKYISRRSGTYNTESLSADQSLVSSQVKKSFETQQANEEQDRKQNIARNSIERQNLDEARLAGIARSIRRSGTTGVENGTTSAIVQSRGYAYCQSPGSSVSYFSRVFHKPLDWNMGINPALAFRHFLKARFQNTNVDVSCYSAPSQGVAASKRDELVGQYRSLSDVVMADWVYNEEQ